MQDRPAAARPTGTASAGRPAYVYGVTTTGIFCRPGCRSRRPRPEHVRIFPSPEAALAAGFRPCKRCRPDAHPDGPDVELVEAAEALIRERFREPLTLAALGRALAVSPYHLARTFKRIRGITPGRYLLATRIRAAQQTLAAGSSRSVAATAQAVGFRSVSHFATVFRRITGMTPGAYRAAHRDPVGPPEAERG
jgi:AraC family transcriptional regulator of adaptative response / methylphosphotriester-DNA alkyltransferase methyltransferase